VIYNLHQQVQVTKTVNLQKKNYVQVANKIINKKSNYRMKYAKKSILTSIKLKRTQKKLEKPNLPNLEVICCDNVLCSN
jgi:hypothetical protein